MCFINPIIHYITNSLFNQGDSMQTQISLKIAPQLDDLNKAVSKVKKSLEIDLGSSIVNAAKNASSKINKSISFKDIFSKDLKAINKTLKESYSLALDYSMQKHMDKVKSGFAHIVSTGIAAYGTIGKTLKDSMNFEESFADVKKVLDSATDSVKLKEGILDMSTWIGFSSDDLNKIAFAAGQMGLKGEKQILKFTELAAKMGIAFDSTSQEAGEAMSKLLNIFELNLDEVESLGDAINNLANNTNAKAMDIVQTLGRIGGAAKDFGLTAEQTAALSDSFIALGQSPEIAGTAIKNMLGKLNAGKANIQKWFGNMGLDYESWAELKLKSPEEALRSFLGELGKLEGREKTLAITEMFGLENLDKISTLAGALQNYDKAISLNKENYKGSMEDEYKARASTTKFEFTKLQGTLDKISITLGDFLLPYVNQLATWVNEMLEPLSKWIKSNENLVKITMGVVGAIFGLKIVTTAASMAFSTLQVILYPLQKIFYFMRFSILGNTMALIASRTATLGSVVSTKAYILAMSGASLATKAWGIATSAFSKLFKVSMWSIKGALISTGIGALIVGIGLAISYVCENWESIAPKLIAVWEWIKEAISPITEWFMDIFDFIGKGIDKILSGARAVTDFLGITDSNDTPTMLDTSGVVEKTIRAQTQNAQNFYNNTQNRAINDNKTIYINTTASANEVAEAINAYSYSYAD